MKKLFATALLLMVVQAVGATQMSADQIMEKANLAAIYPGQDGRAEARMTIVDSQGRKQLRQFVILRKNVESGGDQNYLVVFTKPADVERTSFLVKKHPGKDDDRWLYLPGLDLVKRIAAGDKRTSFVGSTFFYEDISGRDLQADTHELIGEDEKYWQIRNTPKAGESPEFSYYIVWIDKQNFLPMKAEYHDAKGKAYRRMEAKDVQIIEDIATITQMKATDLNTNQYTINQMRFIDYNRGLPDDVFTERSLRNPPQQWLSR